MRRFAVSREMPHADTYHLHDACVGDDYTYKVHIAFINAAKQTFKGLLKILAYITAINHRPTEPEN